MGDYDDLIAAAGTQPQAEPTKPAATAAPAGDYGDLIAAANGPATAPPDESNDSGFFGAMRRLDKYIGQNFTEPLSQGARDTLSLFNKGVPFGTVAQSGFDALASGKSFQEARAARKAEEDAASERAGVIGYAPELLGGVVGGTALGAIGGAVAPGTAAALEAANPVVRGISAGGGLGAVQGVSDTAREGGGTAADYLRNASAGATGGAITGGVLEGALGKLVKGAPESADSWIVKDIAGQGDTAAGDKATDKLRLDAADVRAVIKSDPELADLADKAAGHHVPELKNFQAGIDQRLAAETPGKAAEYAKVAEAKPIRFGDLDAELETAQKALPVSQRGIAKEIAGERAALREGWATKDVAAIPPEALAQEVAPGVTLGRVLQDYHDTLTNPLSHPESIAGAKQGISEIEQQFGKTVRKYDPDTIIDPMKLRQHVTALQDTAGRSADVGAATPSERNIAANKVKRPFEQFFYNHLDQAAETSPEAQRAVNAIRDSDARVSALLNMKQATSQRVAAAERNAMEGMQPAFGFRGAIHRAGQKLGLGPFALPAMALAMGHAPVAAGLAMTMAAPAAKRMADKALARLIAKAATGSVGHKLVLQAIESGVPRAVAMRVASSAVGGLVNDVTGGAPIVQPQQVSP